MNNDKHKSRNMSKKTAISYETLYEEWLMECGDAKEGIESNEKDEKALSAALGCRPNFAKTLHCATLNSRQNVQELQELWNQTSRKIDGNVGNEIYSLASAENNREAVQSARAQSTNAENAFFYDYAECIRQDFKESDSSTDDDSDLEEENVAPTPAKKRASPQQDEIVLVEKVVVAPSQAESHFSYTEPSQQQQHLAPMQPPPQNPYAQQQYNQLVPAPPPPSYQQSNNANRYNNNSVNNNAAWDSFRSQQNPFQTARELAQVGGNNDHNMESRNEYQHQPTQYQQQQQHNPYARQPQAPPQEQLRGPNIPDSLKRKFQPPKRGLENNQKNSTKKKGAILSNGGGNLTRNSKPEHDEELPEALKGLDKELIEKIQNEIMESGESVTFDSIAGLDDCKQTVRELVCWPMKRPDLFTGLRRGPNGLLLFGPPGTGKTLIGKAIAYESKATFFSISSSSLTSKWIGEGEKLVRTLFAVAAYREPAVVFIDEIDSLLTQRKADENEASRRIKTEFLVQLDGTGTSGQGRVLVIGATNRPHELDDAARRRFVKRLYVPLPAEDDRRVLLETLLKTNRHVLEEKCFVKLAKETDGFSGADLKALCTEAAMGPIRQLGPRALEVAPEDVPPIAYKHFRQALRGMHPSVAQSDLDVYIEWNKTYGNKSTSAMDDEDEDDDGDDSDSS